MDTAALYGVGGDLTHAQSVWTGDEAETPEGKKTPAGKKSAGGHRRPPSTCFIEVNSMVKVALTPPLSAK